MKITNDDKIYLKGIHENILNLEDKISEVRTEINNILIEAEGKGFKRAEIKNAIKLLKKEKNERETSQFMVEAIINAIEE